MLGALGGITLVAMVLSMFIDRRLVPFQWSVATVLMAMYAWEVGM